MKLLKYGIAGLVSAIGVLAACGSSDSGGGGGAPAVPCNLAATAGCSAAVTCAQQKCGAQISTAFGADYKSGACATLVTCLNACPCGSTGATCVDNCEADPANLTAACQQAFSAVGTCTDQNCANACPTGAGGTTGNAGGATGSGGTGVGGTGVGGTGVGGTGIGGTGAGGTYTCAQLTTCCATLPAEDQASCTDAASSGDQTECSVAYSVLCAAPAHTCADLTTCCGTLTGATQTDCLQVVQVAAGSDALCGLAYSSFCP
jgi:hypothetical protein